MFKDFSFREVLAAFMILFAVIDILGSVPIVVGIKRRVGKIQAFRVSAISFALLLLFLFVGEAFLKFYGIDVSSFAIAGALILFVLALEMIMGWELFKYELPSAAGLVPLAFPLIAGAASFTTLLAMRAEYHMVNIVVALFLNMVVVFIVLRSTSKIERVVGEAGLFVLKKFFGVIVLAISVKLFLNNLFVALANHQ
ncbi:MAG: MarC family protein [Bacteroidales bacterium]